MNTIVIGATLDDIGASGSQGSAYIFAWSGASWGQQQKLTAFDGAAGDNFGESVAISEDGATVLVGAVSDDVLGSSNQGSAYTFNRSGLVWTQQQQLAGGDGTANDHFGITVAISGETAVIGAPNHSNFRGAAYVFGLAVIPPATITVNPANATLPTGMAGQSYSQTFTAGGGNAPYTFSVSAGNLPNGLNLSTGGALSGAPVAFGNFNFTVKAIDANGNQGTRAYTLTINPPCAAITVNPASLPAGNAGQVYSFPIPSPWGWARMGRSRSSPAPRRISSWISRAITLLRGLAACTTIRCPRQCDCLTLVRVRRRARRRERH